MTDNTKVISVKDLLKKGYSPSAIAMHLGYACGTREHYDFIKGLDPDMKEGCPFYGKICFGTGDCNCQED